MIVPFSFNAEEIVLRTYTHKCIDTYALSLPNSSKNIFTLTHIQNIVQLDQHYHENSFELCIYVSHGNDFIDISTDVSL